MESSLNHDNHNDDDNQTEQTETTDAAMPALVKDLFQVADDEAIEYVEDYDDRDKNLMTPNNVDEKKPINQAKRRKRSVEKCSSDDDNESDEDFSEGMLELGAAVGNVATALTKIGNALSKRKKRKTKI